jgi:uncharacterized protein (TIGR03437 family)
MSAAGIPSQTVTVRLIVTAAPIIRSVSNGASFQPGISSGAWISIFGANLAPTTRLWRDSEIVGGKQPTQLDGVSVNINSKPAAICYISPTQLNVQVPTDDAVGTVQVQVTTPQGTASATAQMQPFSPGLFSFDGKYVAALHADYSYVGKPNLFSDATSTPAKPGEVVLLFGTGFGPTNPSIPAGQVVTQAAPLANPVAIRIGNARAEVQWAGLSGAGLWQFNVKIPEELPDGDGAVVAEIGGMRTQDNVFVAIQR